MGTSTRGLTAALSRGHCVVPAISFLSPYGSGMAERWAHQTVAYHAASMFASVITYETLYVGFLRYEEGVVACL